MTTILAVRKNGVVVMGGDGQVTLGSSVLKHGAKKVRKIFNRSVLVGFAGSAADGLALMERLEGKLEEFRGNLLRASVELAKEWRTDRALRRLDAMLLCANLENLLVISGTGDVMEPDEPIMAIGSGGDYARACALALYKHTSLSAEEIVKEALSIAAKICIYTNESFFLERLP